MDALAVLDKRFERLKDADLLGDRSVSEASTQFRALGEGAAWTELRGNPLPPDPERFWRNAFHALITGFAAPLPGERVGAPGIEPVDLSRVKEDWLLRLPATCDRSTQRSQIHRAQPVVRYRLQRSATLQNLRKACLQPVACPPRVLGRVEEMRIDLERDARVRVTKLPGHVHDVLPLPDEEVCGFPNERA